MLKDILGKLCADNGITLYIKQDVFHVFARIRETLTRNHPVL